MLKNLVCHLLCYKKEGFCTEKGALRTCTEYERYEVVQNFDRQVLIDKIQN